MSTKMPTNKAELIDVMATAADISKAAAAKALAAFLHSITASMRAGQQVSILGFGTFAMKARAAREGRNPKTGETLHIPAMNVPVFKAGKSLKDAVNSPAVTVEEEETV